MGAAVADAAAEMRFHSSDGGERVMNRSLRRRHQHHQQAAQLKGSQLLLQQSQAVPGSPRQSQPAPVRHKYQAYYHSVNN